MKGSRSAVPVRFVRLPLRLLVVVSSLVAAAATALGTAEPAQAANLWHCEPGGQGQGFRVCTTITSAPASGVQVKVVETGRYFTLHNGDSVFLKSWSRDTSGKCGINGDPYVWQASWSGGGMSGGYSVYIGDWYLSTGSPSYWKNYDTDLNPGGTTLGDLDRCVGHGSCDVYPNG